MNYIYYYVVWINTEAAQIILLQKCIFGQVKQEEIKLKLKYNL